MKIPKYIEFHNNTNSILSQFLMAAEPAEGCALLIGKRTNFWKINHVWKCSNIWGQKKSRLIDHNLSTFHNRTHAQLSKKNRFEIDAKDQIAAQKWARRNDLEVLCSAHSHPVGENIPSETDLYWHEAPGLMVIANKNGKLKAWWINNKFSFHRVKIKVFSLT